jgi:hypothetical protein
MGIDSPDFVSLARIEEDLLVAKLEATRAAISHAGEKGRTLEQHVQALLRDLLPAEYGLSTGFVVWRSPHGPTLSTQLDIIIYDAIRGSPLIRLDTCDVFPLEAVYGYVEVKASLTSTSDAAAEPASNSIEVCVERNAALRGMDTRNFIVTIAGSPIAVERQCIPWMSLRSYIVAFEVAGAVAGQPAAFAGRMADLLKRKGPPAHIHGVFVPKHGLFYTRPVDVREADPEDYFHVRYTTEHSLLAFKSLLLEGLATFPRPSQDWSIDLSGYLPHVADWQESSPT